MNRRRTILCIDDDPMINDVIKNYFEGDEYAVLTAENGQEGLDLIKFHKPDVVLVDLNMPVVNGFQVLEVMTSNYPDTPTIVISGEGDMEDVIQALHLGAWHYLTKPVESLKIVQHAIKQTMEKAMLMQQAKAHQMGLERKLGEIISRFRDFIITCDKGLRITYMNPALVEYMGGESLGRRCSDIFVNKADGKSWWPEDITDRGNGRLEVQNLNDGRWYDVTCLNILGHDEEIEEYQIIMQDTTVQKQQMLDMHYREESLRDENTRLLASLTDRYRFGDIIGKSAPMQEVYRTIISAGKTNASVVLFGESGTGKELVARSIHDNSERKDHSFVCVNCGAIPENLIESEFFGYKRGAFSGAAKDKFGFLDVANQGTLFLDEVGEIPVNLQTKLLRAIEGGGYTPLGGTELKIPDIRIIAATNKDLKALVRSGAMREDFLYRIHVIPITLPPLRERESDIPILIDHFLEMMGTEENVELPLSVVSALRKYKWPGNVRELRNTIERFLALGKLDFMALEEPQAMESAYDSNVDIELSGRSLTQAMDGVEKKILTKAFEQFGWHRTRTAKQLGIDRKTLYRKMQYHSIEAPPDF